MERVPDAPTDDALDAAEAISSSPGPSVRHRDQAARQACRFPARYLGGPPGAIADALDGDAPLRRYALVEAVEGGGGSVRFRAARRLARYLFDLPARFLDEVARDGMRAAQVDAAERERFAPLVEPALDVMR